MGLAYGARLVASAGTLQIGTFPAGPACPRLDLCGCFYAVGILVGGADRSGREYGQTGESPMAHFNSVFCSGQKTLAPALAPAWS